MALNLLHETVNHTVFGNGEIVAQSDSIVTVCFHNDNNNKTEKKFLYPQAFDRYLTLSNPDLLPRLESELSVIRIQTMNEQKRIEEAQYAERIALEKVRTEGKPKRPLRTRAKK